MSKHWKGFKKHCFKMLISGREVENITIIMELLNKLVRNSEYSKCGDFKRLSVLAQIRFGDSYGRLMVTKFAHYPIKFTSYFLQ